jgi:hypothetical protein
MKNKFDELAKGLAQSTTRRRALKKFGVGLAGMLLACFGLASRVEAGQSACKKCIQQCKQRGGSNSYCGEICSLICNPIIGPRGMG